MTKVTAIDPGSHALKILTLSDGKHGLRVERFALLEPDAGLAAAGIPLKGAVAGLAGRDMTLRYTQVPPSPEWQLRNLMELEIQDLSAQSGGALSADFNLLPIDDEEGGTETVLLAFAKDEALERVAAEVRSAGGSVGGHVPNCVALYNAWLRCGEPDEEQVVCLANLGHETIDLAVVRGGDLLFVRNLSSGGKVFDDAIAAAFNVGARKAESLKKDLLDLDPKSRGRYASGQAEKVTMAAGGASSMIVSAIQSSLAFCRSQTRQPDLQLDRLLLCGGTARVRGLRGALREALKVPVDCFDPFAAVDTAKLDPEEFAVLDANRHEAVVALGLAVGKLDDKLYELEILPEAVRRRRRFRERTVWNIGAAVVAAALLLATAMTNRERAEEAELAARTVNQLKSRLNTVHTQTEQLVAQNTAASLLVADLAQRAVPLDGVVLTLRALQETMPAEFWVTQLRVENRGAPGRQGASAVQKPIVVLEGAGKDVSGRNIAVAYTEFLDAFRAHGAGGVPMEVVPDSTTDALGNITFTWRIDFRPEPAAPADTDEGGR